MSEAPAGWRWAKLKELVSDRREWITLTDDSEYRRVTARVRNQGIVLRDTVCGRDVRTKRQQVVYRGDLLVAEIDAKVGGFGIVPDELDGAVVSSHYFAFKPDTRLVATEWVDQVVRIGALHEQVSAVGSTNYSSIRRQHVHDFDILLPPLGEQRKIASILKAVDKAIERTQAVVDQVQVVKTGLMQELLTRGIPGRHARLKQTELGKIPAEWRIVPLGELAWITSGSRGWSQFYADQGDIFLRSQNVRDGFLDFSDLQCIRPPATAEAQRTRALSGDVLITITGNSIGNVALLSTLPITGAVYVSQHVAIVRPELAGLGDYLAEYFSRSGPGGGLIEKAQYGQSKPGLSLVGLRSMRVLVPPEVEMSAIARIGKALQHILAIQVLHLEEYRRLKQALATRLLTGQLHVRPDPSPEFAP